MKNPRIFSRILRVTGVLVSAIYIFLSSVSLILMIELLGHGVNETALYFVIGTAFLTNPLIFGGFLNHYRLRPAIYLAGASIVVYSVIFALTASEIRPGMLLSIPIFGLSSILYVIGWIMYRRQRSPMESTVASEEPPPIVEDDTELEGVTECDNCGQPRKGKFCGECGQDNCNYERNIIPLAGEFITGKFEWVLRLLLTLWYLLLRPGFLSEEFSENRRAKYIRPTHLYALLSFLLFVVLKVYARAFEHETPTPHPSGVAMQEMLDTSAISCLTCGDEDVSRGDETARELPPQSTSEKWSAADHDMEVALDEPSTRLGDESSGEGVSGGDETARELPSQSASEKWSAADHDMEVALDEPNARLGDESSGEGVSRGDETARELPPQSTSEKWSAADHDMEVALDEPNACLGDESSGEGGAYVVYNENNLMNREALYMVLCRIGCVAIRLWGTIKGILEEFNGIESETLEQIGGELQKAVKEGIDKTYERPEYAAWKLFTVVSSALIFAQLFFAPCLKILYLSEDRSYAQHMVFSIHVHCIVFIGLTAIIIFMFPAFPNNRDLIVPLIVLAMFAHSFLALRRFYREDVGILLTIAKASLLMVVYIPLFLTFLLGSALAVLLAMPIIA